MARVFRPKKTAGTIKTIGFVVVLALAVYFVHWGLGGLGTTQEERQIEIARDAIVKAAVQCYALESQYPPSLEYLVDNYGLTLDEKKYVYHYRTIGSNMVPEIQIFPVNSRTGGR